MSANRTSAVCVFLALLVFSGCGESYHTVADYPGFDQYFEDRCDPPPPPLSEHDRALLRRYRPRFVLPPGGAYPVGFYRDYTPYTVMRTWPGRKIVALEVNRGLLLKHRADRGLYLDFDFERYRAEGQDVRWEGEAGKPPDREPVVYGRIYREKVTFPDGAGGVVNREMTFLKYNPVFATSGLPWELPFWSRFLLTVTGLGPEDWHALDNFVAAHIVLDEKEAPVAVILAQHNHHRTFLLGRDIPFPEDGRITLDVALRSNEIYPASESTGPVRHRVIRWNIYLDYLLSGENAPALEAFDVTLGEKAGGSSFHYDLKFPSPCDPLYTSEMLLGPPRPFLGMYLGRDGPPGSDYYAVPALLPLGNLLKFAYLQDGDRQDIELVRSAIDRKKKTVDIRRIMQYGGRTFLEDWRQSAEEDQGSGQ